MSPSLNHRAYSFRSTVLLFKPKKTTSLPCKPNPCNEKRYTLCPLSQRENLLSLQDPFLNCREPVFKTDGSLHAPCSTLHKLVLISCRILQATCSTYVFYSFYPSSENSETGSTVLQVSEGGNDVEKT